MRGRLLLVLALLLASAPALAQTSSDKYAVRYGVAVDRERYDQATPRATLRSAILAIENREIEYLLAQLIVPAQVDAKFADDPPALKELAERMNPADGQAMIQALSRHLSEGRWTILRTTARSEVTGLPEITLERIGSRWFVYNVAR